jgi:hypothetical protein
VSTCYGCGLRITGVDGSLEAATAEEWGSGALAGFGGDDTSGAPVYCDSNGQLRTVPEHTSDTFDGAASQASTSIADGAAVTGATTTVTVNNPSALRAANLIGVAGVIEQLEWDGANSTWVSSVDMTRNGVPFVALSGQYRPEGDPDFPGSFYWSPEASFVDSLAAGASVTYVSTCAVDAASGTAGAFTSRVSIRGLVVTQ